MDEWIGNCSNKVVKGRVVDFVCKVYLKIRCSELISLKPGKIEQPPFIGQYKFFQILI